MRRSRSTAASEGGIFVGCFFAAGFLFAVDDFGAERDELEVVVVKREIEKSIEERSDEYHERASPDDRRLPHADDDSSR